MSDFYVGQEVVCVDASPQLGGGTHWPRRGAPIRNGEHYFIREVCECLDGSGGVRLRGVSYNRTDDQRDVPFWITRFRPINPDSIAIFREMCTRKLIDVGAE